MFDKKEPEKPTNPPKDQPKNQPKEEGKGQAKEASSGTLDWLIEADRYEPPKQPPKSTGDWIEDDGKIV
ncbi:hypothetical protein ANO14919_090140 [Xylariales sp. No.14919]|nr:hypothetical protein ANO14919_090140 [Xylariales sp. No.14919]